MKTVGPSHIFVPEVDLAWPTFPNEPMDALLERVHPEGGIGSNAVIILCFLGFVYVYPPQSPY
jgi:hypothetical protein